MAITIETVTRWRSGAFRSSLDDARTAAADMALLVAAVLFGGLFFMAFLPAAGFFFGAAVGPIHFWAALALTALWAGAAKRALLPGRPHMGALSLAIVIILVFLAFSISAMWPDIGPDVRTYHYSAIDALLSGWNPNAGSYRAFTGADDFRIEYFPRATWYILATLSSVVGFESANALNALGAAGVFFAAAGALLRIKATPAWAAGLLALAAAANPVAGAQLFSAYADGLLATTTIAAGFLALALAVRANVVTAITLGMAVAVGINLKSTGVVMIGVPIGAVWLTALLGMRNVNWWNCTRRILMGPVIGGLIGVFIVGYTPYVTNFVDHGNPFYPLGANLEPFGWGDTTFVEAAQSGMPDEWATASAPERFVKSVFSETHNAWTWAWKPPFVIRPVEAEAFQGVGPRIGGFGPLFSGALILAAVAFAAGLTVRPFDRFAGVSLAMICLLTVSIVMNPVAHDARYNVLAAVLPLALIGLALGFSADSARLKWAVGPRALAAAAMLVLIFNGWWIACRHMEALKLMDMELAQHVATMRQLGAETPIAPQDGFWHPWLDVVLERYDLDYRRTTGTEIRRSGYCIGAIPRLEIEYGRPCAEGESPDL